MTISLDRVVPFGRSRREYELMFNLSEKDLAKRILGCADGPASFNAEMNADGFSVVSTDPIYQFTGQQIKHRFEENLEAVLDQVKATPNCWTWTYHRNIEDLRRNRCLVMDRFLADYETGREQGRYRVAALLDLPFRDGEFELALCSHFLFLYSDLYSEAFHVASAIELCRVADETRIFPLLTLAQQLSPHVEAVRKAVASMGIESTIETVEYELQKGGNQTLRLFRC
jgi:hypothetical protein